MKRIKKVVNAIAEKLRKGFCVNHTGKMAGMISLSTSCKDNVFCMERAKNPDTICAHCYAQAQLAYQPNTEKKSRRNEWLCNTLLQPDDVPTINASKFRFEAFGDLQSVVQFVNYVTIAKQNPGCMFTLWTKNYFIVRYAVKLFPGLYDEKKKHFAKNFILIVSSPFMDKQLNIDNYPMADKVFTVYTNKSSADEHGVKINCGARQCLTCGRCYSKRTGAYVNELKH